MEGLGSSTVLGGMNRGVVASVTRVLPDESLGKFFDRNERLCVLQIMRMVEGLEGKGMHMALSRGEAKLGEHLRGLTRQVSGVETRVWFAGCRGACVVEWANPGERV